MSKICFLLVSYFKYYKGGAELQAYQIARMITQYDEVHYIFVNNPGYFQINDSMRNDEGINLHWIRRYNLSILGKSLFLNYFKLKNLFNEINPDIIYQRNGNAFTGIAALWCKKNNKKLIFGISSDNNCSSREILNLGIDFLSYPSKVLDYFFNVYGVNNAFQIIAQTDYQKKILRQNFKRGCIVIPNGLPVPLQSFKKADPPIISWIANIKPLKQPELFIKLAEKCQDLNAQFIYAGRPESGKYHRMLTEKTKKLINLQYIGEIPFEKTNELLSLSSIFVNTSTAEGFPNTYIQAWMRETPVVTLNCDPDNIIKTQRIGFHSGGFEQLVEDVRYLIENEDERNRMGEKARKYAIENHDIMKTGKKYIELFHQLNS